MTSRHLLINHSNYTIFHLILGNYLYHFYLKLNEEIYF